MDPLEELVGRSALIATVREHVRTLLEQEAKHRRLPPVLITGETGTGKGLLARVLHRASSRSTGEFVEVNGAAIPEHLLESELFGFERGAFTDARQAKAGLLQVAHRGTLFLDEVGLLPLALQAKLLKVLEEQRLRRLGSTRTEVVDLWVISATNEDLAGAVRSGRFREDLYHRLAVIKLALPPLRERVEDIEVLASAALRLACTKYGSPPKELAPAAMAVLQAYAWPGNVRELNSVIERAVLTTPGASILPAALALDPVAEPERTGPPGPLRGQVAALERRRLTEALAQYGGNLSRTAAALGIARNTLRARMARYGLRAEAPADSTAVRDPGRGAADPGAPPIAPGERTAGATAAAGGGTSPVSAVSLATGRPSIAVLPFRVETEDESRTYLGDGIVEDIVGALASLRELLVISRTSTLRYRGASVDVRAVGRDVGASYVLSGSVRRMRGTMRVSVELAETTRGAVNWAHHFDGAAEDLFALQDQIAARVATIIAPQIREAELRRALRKRPESLDAYDCMLRGVTQLYQLNMADFLEARTWFEQAIVLDPGYAAPYALLAAWHTIRVHQGWSPDAAADNTEALRLATAALARDSFDAVALALCGHAKSLLRYEFDDAIALFNRALDASPSNAIAWTRSSPTYSYLGNAREAIARAEQGIRLSPLDPHVFYPHTSLGIAYYVAGEHDEGARWGRKAREENPLYTANLRFLAANLAAAGALAEAREVAEALVATEPRFHVGRFVDRYAIRDPERRDRLAGHLRLAGLPG